MGETAFLAVFVFSNGLIFTQPRIFRRFLADISETVPLRQKLKKVIFKTIIPSNFEFNGEVARNNGPSNFSVELRL